MNNQDLIKALNWRYATKQFDASKTIDDTTWSSLEQSLILTASSYGLQPWKFIVVKDKSLREKLRPHSWNQSQITDASHLVVFTSKIKLDEEYVSKFISQIANVREVNASDLEQYKQMMLSDVVNGERSKIVSEWAARQTYIALGNILTSAAVLGVDTCAIEGFDPVQYQSILQPDSTYRVVCVCAFGYRSGEDKYSLAKKVRFGKEDIIEYR